MPKTFRRNANDPATTNPLARIFPVCFRQARRPGKIKGPILRGLSARAPFFHNGSAQTLFDGVRFYENRFGLVLTKQDELDLVNFLSVL